MNPLDFDGITVKGAREHNLKNISVQIPRNKMTVLTGLSGSGKSSLAFDIIYAEGQRRYIESLSTYARNFMDQLKKPQVESITGLSPAIAIDQKSLALSPRSTVGTVTEIYDYLRLLYARVGIPSCPEHGVPVQSQSPQQILEDVMSLPSGTKFFVLAPVAQGEKGEFLSEFQKWRKKGFVRARVDGEWVELSEAKKLHKHKRHDIDLLVDRLVVEEKFKPRLSDSIHLALSLTKGVVSVEPLGQKPKLYSIHLACPVCAFSFPEMEPRMFSFNNPRGACPTCKGMGRLVDEEVELEDEAPGIQEEVCPDCRGARLKSEVLNVRVGGFSIAEMSSWPAGELLRFFKNHDFGSKAGLIAEKIVKQICGRLEYLERVGTGYLSLDRESRTLSGGEAQRIRLATQVGSSLVGVLYVLDEPSIGLHPRDHGRLLEVLREIRERGNTVLLVEHDEETILGADHVIDLGPGAGERGGEIMAVGSPEELKADPKSLTGLYLAGHRVVDSPRERRKGSGKFLDIRGARGNNLKNVNLKIPLGQLVGVTGVSGSGKSTLVVDTLYAHLMREFHDSPLEPTPFDKILGVENLDKVIEINQRPIGRTPRSTPATYVGLFPLIRDLFARMPEAKIRGFRPGQFSFNVKGGRCETCQGGGQVRIEMHFLSDVFVQCESCLGRRYNPEILSIKFRERSISDVLQMTVSEAFDFFQNHKLIRRKLETLKEVGLDYMTLGQSSTTLSGGEAQRVKLSRELSKRSTGRTLYILDEPTTGLHFEDVNKLLHLLNELVDQGNTVLVIEHHLDVIKNCDHLIDMGPEGGSEGGRVVAQGTPEEVAGITSSPTGFFLKKVLIPKTVLS